jgi:hypothetical protein
MFRFTIRDVLWLTVVVGLAVGWVVDHRFVNERYGQQLDIIKDELGPEYLSLEPDLQGVYHVLTAPAEGPYRPTESNRP